jgi:hypothetical protein
MSGMRARTCQLFRRFAPKQGTRKRRKAFGKSGVACSYLPQAHLRVSAFLPTGFPARSAVLTARLSEES